VRPNSSQVQPLVIAIYGPTGVGKTSCAVELALALDGEVVNADSRYLYRHLTIGVAKPTAAERNGVPHHLIDVFEPSEMITLGQVQQLAYSAIEEVLGRGKRPILVGGTPLYMNAITEGWRIPAVAPDWDFRAVLADRIEREGLPAVTAELARIDPAAAERSGQNARRVVRALEIHHVTGQPMTSLEGKAPPPYRFIKIALTRSRGALYAALDARVDRQIEAGLIDEVRALLASGLTGDKPAFSAIGYRQFLPYLAGEDGLEGAIERIKTDTHRYVRHQMTWLRKTPHLIWVDTGESGWRERVLALVSEPELDIGTAKP
jgi:tRNA dimethylallyltransferase